MGRRVFGIRTGSALLQDTSRIALTFQELIGAARVPVLKQVEQRHVTMSFHAHGRHHRTTTGFLSDAITEAMVEGE